MPNQAFSKVPEQLQRQFEQLGQELSAMMLEQFKSVLSSEQKGVEKTLETLVSRQRHIILRQVQKELEQTILRQFGSDNPLFEILANQMLPNVIARMSGEGDSGVGASISPSFGRSGNQSVASLGKAIQLVLSRYR